MQQTPAARPAQVDCRRHHHLPGDSAGRSRGQFVASELALGAVGDVVDLAAVVGQRCGQEVGHADARTDGPAE